MVGGGLMYANQPRELLDLPDFRERARRLSLARQEMTDEAERWGLKAAEMEFEYRKQYASRFAFHRSEEGGGNAVQAADILARGDVAELARGRDEAKTFEKTARERIAQLEADRAGLNRWAEWSMRLSPTGELAA